MGDVLTSGDLNVGQKWPRSTHIGILYRGKQQYTLNSLIASLWKICAAIQICQIQIENGCCDLENDGKVKLFIWYKGLAKDIHLAYWKGHCCQKPLNDKHTLFPLEYMEKVNFDL